MKNLNIMLYLLSETFTNGFNRSLLNVISVQSIFCALLVIISKNPVVSVLFLIALFFNIASYLMMLGINFIGLSYLLVYVGAVSILFLFILMLINVRISELVTNNNNSIPLAIAIGIIFYPVLYRLLSSNFYVQKYTYNSDFKTTHDNITESFDIKNRLSNVFNTNNGDLSLATSHMWDGFISESSHITTIGNVIYTAYPLWLILTSIILLLAMVGAIVITIKQ